MIIGIDSSAAAPRSLRRAAATLAIAMAVTTLVATGSAVDTAAAQNSTPTSTPATSMPGSESTAIGPGISVKEARRTKVPGPVLVVGYLLAVPHAPLRLCDALSRSRPPRCAGASLKVRGLPAHERNGLATEHRLSSPARWSPQPVQILGNVQKTTLVVQTTAKA